MLPIISEETAGKVFSEVFADMPKWRKQMIQYLKEENPEINTAIISAAQNTQLDAKAIALGAYMTYVLLEVATKEDETLITFNE